MARRPGGRGSRKRLAEALERTESKIALLREEIEIKDARWSRLSSRRRPHYTPVQRMRILQLKAARGWSRDEAARRFLVNEETMLSWVQRVDEEGDRALLQTDEPVNRFPDFVRHLVRQLKLLLPTMGKVRIAQVLARAGLHLGATTVGRFLKDDSPLPDEEEESGVEVETEVPRVVTAKYPGHVWHVDLTTVPTRAGFWVPWLPGSWPQCWPFCWWMTVVIDHFSRSVVGFALFKKHPTSLEVLKFLARAVRKAGKPPKYVVTDRGSQFDCPSFREWCRRRYVRPRYGAVGQYGSVAVIERFIRSLKTECTRRILVPLRVDEMRREIDLYATWYNDHRPSQALDGLTPGEVRDGITPANTKPRFEPISKWPQGSRCAEPQAPLSRTPGTQLKLVVSFVEGRKHLPVIKLRPAA